MTEMKIWVEHEMISNYLQQSLIQLFSSLTLKQAQIIIYPSQLYEQNVQKIEHSPAAYGGRSLPMGWTY